MYTILTGINLELFKEKVETNVLKKVEGIAVLEEDFFDIVEFLQTKYKIELKEVRNNKIIEDKSFVIFDIKILKQEA